MLAANLSYAAVIETKKAKVSIGEAKEIIKIKFGLDVHSTQITVCSQIGDRTPQPPLKMKWDQALKFIKDFTHSPKNSARLVNAAADPRDSAH